MPGPGRRPGCRRGRRPRRPRPAPGRPGGEWATALSTRLATARSSSAGSAAPAAGSRARRPRPARPRGPRPATAAGTTSSRPTGRMGADDGAGLDAAHVEQVADEAVSRSVSSSMVARNSSRSLVRPGDVGLAEAADRRLDRRQRRAQVVGHGLEQRACAARWPRPAPRPGPPRRRGGARSTAARELGGEGVEHAAVLGRQVVPRSGQHEVVAEVVTHLVGLVGRGGGASPADGLDLPAAVDPAEQRGAGRPKVCAQVVDQDGQRVGVGDDAGQAGQRLGLGRGPRRLGGAAGGGGRRAALTTPARPRGRRRGRGGSRPRRSSSVWTAG